MSIEVGIPVLLSFIFLFVLTEVNSSRTKSLEKRVKKIEDNPDSNWVEARNEYHKHWPREDR